MVLIIRWMIHLKKNLFYDEIAAFQKLDDEFKIYCTCLDQKSDLVTLNI